MRSIIKIIPMVMLALVGCATQSSSVQSSNRQMKTPSGNLLSYVKNDLDRSCKNGSTSDCEYLAEYYYDRKDENNLIKYSNLACKNGLKKACVFVDNYNKQKNKKIKDEEAKRSAKKEVINRNQAEYKRTRENLIQIRDLCNHGDASKCFSLGDYYLNSLDVNPLKSLKYLDKGCKKGTGKSMQTCCYVAGVMYASGDGSGGILRDYDKAYKTLNKSCKAGHTKSCETLHVMGLDIEAGR